MTVHQFEICARPEYSHARCRDLNNQILLGKLCFWSLKLLVAIQAAVFGTNGGEGSYLICRAQVKRTPFNLFLGPLKDIPRTLSVANRMARMCDRTKPHRRRDRNSELRLTDRRIKRSGSHQHDPGRSPQPRLHFPQFSLDIAGPAPPSLEDGWFLSSPLLAGEHGGAKAAAYFLGLQLFTVHICDV